METINWKLDTTHSEVAFKVKHMMFTNVSGRFNTFNLELKVLEDKFETASVHFSADVNSINTNNIDRDNHLKSKDFFDAEQFSSITFDSSSIEKVNESNYIISGNLNIKGISKNISLNATYSGLMKDPWGNSKVGFFIEGKINRTDFGLTWNSILESGGVLVGEEIDLNIELQLLKNN